MARARPQPSPSTPMPSFYVSHILLLFVSYLALPLLPVARARLVNITVDDTNPDPLTGATFTYSPPGSWAMGGSCAPCLAKLDPSKVYDATWRDATYDPTSPAKGEIQTAVFQFNGVCPVIDDCWSSELDCQGLLSTYTAFCLKQLAQIRPAHQISCSSLTVNQLGSSSIHHPESLIPMCTISRYGTRIPYRLENIHSYYRTGNQLVSCRLCCLIILFIPGV